ncbi:MAG: hypothetical protein ACYC7H_15675, partial [Chloroflexota bacterium]
TIVFIVTVLAFVLLLVANLASATLSLGESSEVLHRLLNLLAPAYAVAEWLSPFSYLYKVIEAVDLGNIGVSAAVFCTSAAYAAILLVAATFILQLRGVRK